MLKNAKEMCKKIEKDNKAKTTKIYKTQRIFFVSKYLLFNLFI